MEDNNKVPENEIQNQEPQTKPVIESQFEMPKPEIKPAGPKHVLPPVKYKLKTLLMFTDLFVLLIYIYILLIGSIIEDATNDQFSFGSGKMFAFYCVLAITIGMGVLVFISN